MVMEKTNTEIKSGARHGKFAAQRERFSKRENLLCDVATENCRGAGRRETLSKREK
jgi:hypothetical protein